MLKALFLTLLAFSLSAEAQRTRIPNHRPAWPITTADLGEISPTMQLHLILALNRPPTAQRDFDQLLEDQQNPASVHYHQWLTPEQSGRRFGPSAAALAALTGWLTAQGLTVSAPEPSRVFLQADGPAALIERAFETHLHTYAGHGQAPTEDPSLPADLAPLVAHIAGLTQIDDHPHLIEQLSRISTSPHPEATLSGGAHLLGPADFATLYDLNPAYNTGITGQGQRVMIVGGSRLLPSDITQWEQIAGLPAALPSVIVPPTLTDPGITASADQDEATLDFERVYGTAPGAQVDQVIAANWLNGTVNESLLLYAIGTVNDPILSLSFGSCEPLEPAGYVAQEDALYAVAAAQGITVLASSGDAGVAGCESHGQSPPPVQTAAISDICASSHVTCVGGTLFSDTPADWSSTNNTANYGSALGYIPEGAWNEPISPSGAFVVAATGGGASALIPRPAWQTAPGVPAGAQRLIPDVSFSASLHNGYYACLAYQGNCNQYFVVFAGTSASAPSMAGIAALIDQKLAGRQGNLNPLFYATAASTPAAFHDATPASSGIASCGTATPTACNNSNPSPLSLAGGIAGFPLTTGYDEATGLGSLDVSAFLTAITPAPIPTPVPTPVPTPTPAPLPLPQPTPTITLTAVSSTLTLTAASSASAPDLITVASATAYTGPVTFTCTLTQTTAATPPTCLLSASTLQFPVSTNLTATFTTIAPHVLPTHSAAATLTLAALVLAAFPRRRRKSTALLLALVLTGCGSGIRYPAPAASIPITPLAGGTTPGTYRFQLTAIGSNNTVTIPITLTVN